MSSMLVVGSVAFDTLHLPTGSHPKVIGGSATFASIAGSLFAPVRLVGVVGRDFPADAVAMLQKRGVDTAGLEYADGLTFHWEGRYAPDLNSRESIRTELNVFADFQPKIPAAFRDTPFVMLGNIQPELQLAVLEQIQKPKLVVADTMNFWITGRKEALLKTLRRVDVLVLNDEEARELTGQHNIVKVARTLLGLGPSAVVIKRGEHGALLFEGDEIFSAPAYPTGDVVDPTGAGDTFAGAFLGYIARAGEASHATLRRAVVYGSAIASFLVEGVGVERLTHVTPAELEARADRFKKLVHFATDAELRGL